jgi:hypothetical protein
MKSVMKNSEKDEIIDEPVSPSGYQVGPQGICTTAAWSPNGKWMYLAVEVDGGHRLPSE